MAFDKLDLSIKKQLSKNPRYQKIGFGIAGFLMGICSIVVWASADLYNRSVELVSVNHDLTVTAISLPPTPPTPPARAFEDLFSDVEGRIYNDSAGGIKRLEPLLIQDIHILDLAHAHVLIAEAQDNLGNLELATRSQKQIIALLEPSLDTFSSPEDIAEAFAYIISAASWLGDFESMGRFERQLSERFEPALETLDSALEIAEAYTALIGYYSWLGEYEKSQQQTNQLFLRIDPLLPGMTSAQEITIVYQYLLVAAQNAGELEQYQVYLDEAIEHLVPMETQTDNPEELIIILSFLGNAEFTRGRLQFAAAYYRKLIQYERNAANLDSLAYSYYMAGNNNCAYHWYQEYLLGEGPEYDQNRQTAEGVVASIKEIYGDRVPDCK